MLQEPTLEMLLEKLDNEARIIKQAHLKIQREADRIEMHMEKFEGIMDKLERRYR